MDFLPQSKYMQSGELEMLNVWPGDALVACPGCGIGPASSMTQRDRVVWKMSEEKMSAPSLINHTLIKTWVCIPHNISAIRFP